MKIWSDATGDVVFDNQSGDPDDAVHGLGHPFEATLFPQSIGMGATWDVALAEAAGSATRQQLLATAATQMESARVEANKQVRYLSLSVAPVPPDEPTYPKALQNTIVAFFIFAGIYLMMSLTASILREQVSS